MDSKAVLARAKVLVRESESDALARAALAVQMSEYGAARRVQALLAALNDGPVPKVTPIDINGIRATVLKETGLRIELDDPFLLMLVATQDVGLCNLERAIMEMKRKKLSRIIAKMIEEISIAISNEWMVLLLCITLGAVAALALVAPLARWLP